MTTTRSTLIRDPRYRGDPNAEYEFLLIMRSDTRIEDMYYFNRLDPLVKELSLSMSDLNKADPREHPGCM